MILEFDQYTQRLEELREQLPLRYKEGVTVEMDLPAGSVQVFADAELLERAVLNGNFEAVWPHLAWVLGYTVIVIAAAVLLFLRQMKEQ